LVPVKDSLLGHIEKNPGLASSKTPNGVLMDFHAKVFTENLAAALAHTTMKKVALLAFPAAGRTQVAP